MRMKPFLLSTLFSLLGLLSPQSARAQFVGYTSPQTVQQLVLTSASGPTTALVANGGGLNPAGITLRLEGSNDGVTFFPISDDATDAAQGEVYAIGYYPVIRVNLVTFSINFGAPRITASYSGTSGTAGQPLGLLNASQSYRKLLFSNLSAGANQSLIITPPFGSSAGYIFVNSSGAFPGGSTLTVTCVTAVGQVSFPAVTPSSGAITPVAIPPCPATSIQVAYTSGGASATTFSAVYNFFGAAPNNLFAPNVQGPATQNSETVSAANTAITVLLFGTQATRAHLYSVSARCSAGTASLTVKDGAGTTIWTTSATEVGTSTFRYQWVPGLAGSFSNTMNVILSTCGAANTGTLDVQASVY
jgi:hypothetical protein